MFLHRSFNYDYACAHKNTTSISVTAKAEAVSSSASVEDASIEDQRNRWPGYPDTYVDRQLTGVKTAESRAPWNSGPTVTGTKRASGPGLRTCV